jgi:sugar/nucleoside kinase (ribokinase family)
LTRSASGSVILADGAEHHIAAAPVARVVDTTGAGDLYASGFLHGLTRDLPLPICGKIGSLCAAEIISHFGARPEVKLAQLVDRAGLP